MSKKYFLPPACFGDIKTYALKNGLNEMLEIVAKQNRGDITLEQWEANLLLKVAKLWQIEAELKFPFWDSQHPRYKPEHEERYFEEQEERFGKLAMTFRNE